MRPITKRIFLTALTCPTLGGLMRQDQIRNTITAAARFQIEQSLEIGRRARALYPTGHLIATNDFNSAVTATQNLMTHTNTQTLFEPAFHTEEVKARIVDFKPVCIELEELTRMPEKPEPELQIECRGCELFKDCIGQGIDNHIFDLPRLNQARFDELTAWGILCIEDIPLELPLTANQARVKDCVQLKTIPNNSDVDLLVSWGSRAEVKTICWKNTIGYTWRGQIIPFLSEGVFLAFEIKNIKAMFPNCSGRGDYMRK